MAQTINSLNLKASKVNELTVVSIENIILAIAERPKCKVNWYLVQLLSALWNIILMMKWELIFSIFYENYCKNGLVCARMKP